MTHVVVDSCIKCKYGDCVVVCPVDCFYEGKNMLVIDPQVCIDCGVCIAECPVGAIVEDINLSKEQLFFLEINATYAKIWPNIKHKPNTPIDKANQYAQETNKFNKYFNENL